MTVVYALNNYAVFYVPNSANDTYISSVLSERNDNFGTESLLCISGQSASIQNAMIYFNFSGLPANATITSASLSLYGSSGSTGRNVFIYYASNDWDGSAATWFLRKPGVNWTTAGGDYDTLISTGTYVSGRKNYDVTNAIRNFVNGTRTNYGFFLTSDYNLGDLCFNQMDSLGSNYDPILNVTWDYPYPATALITPANGSTQSSRTVNFACNITFNGIDSNANITQADIMYFNDSSMDGDSLVDYISFNTTNGITPPNKTLYTNWTTTVPYDGTFYWSCYYDIVYENGNGFGLWADKDAQFTVDSVPPTVTFQTPTPVNGSRNITNSATINVTVSSASSLDTCTLQWNATTTLTNYTMTKSGTTCNYTIATTDGTTYYFKVFANTSIGNLGNTSLRTFRENAEPTNPNIALTPSTAYKNTTLTCSGSASSDADGDSVSYYYQFNDTTSIIQAYSTTNTFNCSAYAACAKGDTIYCNVKAYDSYEYSNINTTSVTISNSPPVIVSWNVSNSTWSISSGTNFSLYENATNGTYIFNVTSVSDGDSDTVLYDFYIDGSRKSTSYTQIWYSWVLGSYAVGYHNVTVYVNDSSNAITSKYWNVTIVDSIKPSVTVTSPIINKYYNYNTSINLNYTATDTHKQACWFNIDNGANTTITNCLNTTFNVSQGSHTVKLYVNDTSNNVNITSISFTADSINPQVAIVYPTNITYQTAVTAINYTVSDTNIQACKYSTNGGITNTTITCGTNITGLSASQGSNTWTVYVNDSAGNSNSSSITFSMDTQAPTITISIPPSDNIWYNYNTNVNFTATDTNLQACWWTNNSGVSNHTLATCGTNVTGQVWDSGTNTVKVYANDSFGNVNSATRIFKIDMIKPQINVTYPVNGSNLLTASLTLNYTVSDTNIQACKYSLNSGLTNTTITCGNNVSGLTAAQGTNIWTVYVNDSAGNVNSSSTTFSVDSQVPTVSIVIPTANGLWFNYQTNVNYTASDVNLQACWYTNDSGLINTTVTCGTNITGKTWPQGLNTVTVYANDSYGGIGSATRTFNIDTINPLLSIVYPLSGANFSTTTIGVNYTVSDTNLNTCKWTKNGGSTNTTLTCGTNITSTFTEGLNTVIIYVNDSANNQNSTNVTFRVDTIGPILNVTSPGNNLRFRDQYDYKVLLNVSAADAGVGVIGSYWYSLNGATNVTFTSPTYVTAQLNNNTIKIYVNDSLGNTVNSSLILFNLTFTPTITDINISNASNSYSRNSTLANLIGWWKFDENHLNISYDSSSNRINGSLVGGNILASFENGVDGFALDCGGSPTYTNVTGLIGDRGVLLYSTGGDGLACMNSPYITDKPVAPNYTIFYYGKGWARVGIWNGSKYVSYVEDVETGCRTNCGANDIPTTCNGGAAYTDWKLFKVVACENASTSPQLWAYARHASRGIENGSYFDFITEGPIWYSKGKIGNAIVFDGHQNYVSMPMSVTSPYSFATNNFSISLWFKTNQSTGTLFMVGNNSQDYYSMYMNGGRLYFNYSTGDVQSMNSSTLYNDNRWHHAVGIRNGVRTGLLYVDNVLVAEDSDNGGSLTGIDILSNTFYIGRDYSGTSYYNGMVDEFRIYNTNLSVTDVSNIYLATNPTFEEYSTLDVSVTTADTDTSLGSLFYSWYVEGVSVLTGTAETLLTWIFDKRSSVVEVYINDTNGYQTYQSWNVSTTFINPTINFTSPTPDNNTITRTTSFIVNFTGTEANRNSGWITMNNVNYTATCTGTSPYVCNRTFTGLTEGMYNYTAYVNDSVGNQNNTETRRYVVDLSGPNFVFNWQSPADITTNNTFGRYINISYNITDAWSNINASTVIFYYKGNSSSSNVQYYQNGSAHSGWFSPAEFTSNVSNTWRFDLSDNYILPATYNFGEVTMENTVHSVNTLSGSNNYVWIELLNVSNTKNYSFFEVMANSTAVAGNLRVYYCNSSYSTGNPVLSSNCIQFNTLSATQTFNHVHTTNSAHQIISMPINIASGSIGSVRVTSTSYFLLRGTFGTWYVYNIANTSRTNAIKTTANNGNAWTSQTYTVDSHLHQFDGSDAFRYYVCANDTSGNTNCSSERSDIFDYANLPPSAPVIINPQQGNYSGNITINYTAAVSPNAYAISFYNITLYNATDETLVTTIRTNNSNNLSYIWNSAGVGDWNYTIHVKACDINGYCSIGMSEELVIENTAPNGTLLTPLNDSITSNVSVNFTANVSDSLTGVKNATLNVYKSGTLFNQSTITLSSELQATIGIIVTLVDGVYDWFYTIFDMAGNSFTTTNNTLTIDTISPVITIHAPISKNYNVNVSLPLNYSVSDLHTQACWWNLDGDSNNTITCGTNTTFNTSSGEEHILYFYANDSAGNVGVSNVSFTTNLGPPSISLDYPTDAQWVNSGLNLLLKYTAVDEDGISECQLWLKNGVWHLNNTQYSPTSGQQYNFTLNLTDSSYEWNVWCNDSGNNGGWGNPLSNNSFIIDSAYPQISFGDNVLASESNVSADSIFVNVSVVEINEANITFYLYNESYYPINVTTSTSNLRYINYTSLDDGLYRYNVTITDLANNRNSTETRVIRLDNEAPTFIIDSPGAFTAYPYNNSIGLNVSVTDNYIGTDTCFYNIYDEFGLLTIDNSTIPCISNTTFSLPDGDVDYFITLYANDTIGNSFDTSFMFRIRTVKPAVNLQNPSLNQYINRTTNIQFNFTVSNRDIAFDTCQLWGNWTDIWHLNQSVNSITKDVVKNFPSLLNLSEASYSYNVWCNDTLNNSDFGASNYTFTLDVTYPSVNITTVSGTTFSSTTFSLGYNISDLHMGTCGYKIDDGSWVDTLTCNESSKSLTLTAGTYNISVRGIDLAGNTNSSTITITTTAPSGQQGGGGGGTTTPKGNRSWEMTTETGTQKYELTMVKGGIRNREIHFTNSEANETFVKVSCEGDLCKYITLSDTDITLPVGMDIVTVIDMTIKLPVDLDDGTYVNNIRGIDQDNQNKIVTVEITIGKSGLPIEVFSKLGATKNIAGLKVPYILFSILSAALVFIACNFFLFRKLRIGLALAIVFAIIAFFGILLVIP